MNRVFFLAGLIGLAPLCGLARTWTDLQGRTVEAEVVRVGPGRTVVLRVENGRTVTSAFDLFSVDDVAYLETLAEAGAPLHPVSWERMNAIFETALWQDASLWDDSTDAVAKRINLRPESKTEFLENYRAYPLGRQVVLGQPVYANALYGMDGQAESVSLVFLNLGDLPPSIDAAEAMKQIDRVGERLGERLESELGTPVRSSLGRGDLREKVSRWDWNGHAILLSVQEGKYAVIRIMGVERADAGGRIARRSDKALEARLAGCVDRRSNGDVVVRNIPMIDQGPKGYCSPATWERYLRYLDIPVDMYLLALAAKTGVGGGTYSQDMIDATGNIIGSYGRKLAKAGSAPSLRNVARHIDRGMPLMWSFMSTPDFQRDANENTARRNGKAVAPAGQTEDSSAGGHICLIVGYNEQTDEIAISDSWGPRFEERWVSVDVMAAQRTLNDLYYIRW